MHLYIMRHGETFWNKKGLIQGSSDIALTPYGEELARDTRDGFDREEIRFQRIYSSPYQRAVKTAEIIAEHQKNYRRSHPLHTWTVWKNSRSDSDLCCFGFH